MMTFSGIVRMFSLGVLDFIIALDYLIGSDQEYDGAIGWMDGVSIFILDG